MGLHLVDGLEPVLDGPEEDVALLERLVFLRGQGICRQQATEGRQGPRLTDLRQAVAVQQLQELDGEFDVTDTARPRLDLTRPPASSMTIAPAAWSQTFSR